MHRHSVLQTSLRINLSGIGILTCIASTFKIEASLGQLRSAKGRLFGTKLHTYYLMIRKHKDGNVH